MRRDIEGCQLENRIRSKVFRVNIITFMFLGNEDRNRLMPSLLSVKTKNLLIQFILSVIIFINSFNSRFFSEVLETSVNQFGIKIILIETQSEQNNPVQFLIFVIILI